MNNAKVYMMTQDSDLIERTLRFTKGFRYSDKEGPDGLYDILRSILYHEDYFDTGWMIENKHLFEAIYRICKNKAFKEELAIEFHVMDSPLEV